MGFKNSGQDPEAARAAAEYLGLDESYLNPDGQWDFFRASAEAGERTRAAQAAAAAGNATQRDANFGFGGVAKDPDYDPFASMEPNAPPPVDTDFAGGMPAIITNPRQPTDFWAGVGASNNGIDQGYEAIDWGGVESPWQGGGQNQDFYSDQFGQLLGQRNDFQQQQAQAAAIRGEQAAADPVDIDYDQIWRDKGLREVQVSGGSLPEGTDPNSWARNQNFGLEKGMTNQQAVNAMNSIWNPDESAMWSQYFGNGGNAGGQYWLSDRAGQDPNAIMSGFENVSPEFGGAVQKFVNNAWGRAGDQTSGGVPAGYALPI